MARIFFSPGGHFLLLLRKSSDLCSTYIDMPWQPVSPVRILSQSRSEGLGLGRRKRNYIGGSHTLKLNAEKSIHAFFRRLTYARATWTSLCLSPPPQCGDDAACRRGEKALFIIILKTNIKKGGQNTGTRRNIRTIRNAPPNYLLTHHRYFFFLLCLIK